VPHPDDAFCPFFHRPAAWPHTHHVHVVEAGGEEERRTLAFRDYLREHGDAAREYEDLKRRLAPQYSATEFSSRQAYADAKAEFITRVTQGIRRRVSPGIRAAPSNKMLQLTQPSGALSQHGAVWRRTSAPQREPGSAGLRSPSIDPLGRRVASA